MLRTFLAAAGIIALVMGTALAQAPDTPAAPGIPFKVMRDKAPDADEKAQAAERDYNAAMKKIPDKKASSDPWGDVRPPAPSAKNKPQQ
jgi:hypothetical protein